MASRHRRAAQSLHHGVEQLRRNHTAAAWTAAHRASLPVARGLLSTRWKLPVAQWWLRRLTVPLGLAILWGRVAVSQGAARADAQLLHGGQRAIACKS